VFWQTIGEQQRHDDKTDHEAEYVLSTGVNVRDLIDQLSTKDGYLALNVLDLSTESGDIFNPCELTEIQEGFVEQITKYLPIKVPDHLKNALEYLCKVCMHSIAFMIPLCLIITFCISHQSRSPRWQLNSTKVPIG
jgi:hypothetical protein